MESIEFIEKYQRMLDIIEKIMNPKYAEVLKQMRSLDPHELVGPQHTFTSETAAIGFLVVTLHNRILGSE